PNQPPVPATVLTRSQGSVTVKVPQKVALGVADIIVKRPHFRLVAGQYVPDDRKFTSAKLKVDSEYLFAARGSTLDVAAIAIRQKRPNPTTGALEDNPDFNKLVARIQLFASQGGGTARWIAVTPDGTRAYVAMRSGEVAIIDTAALQQIDA